MEPEAMMRAFGERLAERDADGVAALFTEDVAYAEPPMFTSDGRAAFHEFVADFAARHHDVSFTISRIIARPDGSEAALEWRWAYTRDADGEQRVFEGDSFVTFRDGLIASWRGFSARMK